MFQWVPIGFWNEPMQKPSRLAVILRQTYWFHISMEPVFSSVSVFIQRTTYFGLEAWHMSISIDTVRLHSLSYNLPLWLISEDGLIGCSVNYYRFGLLEYHWLMISCVLEMENLFYESALLLLLLWLSLLLLFPLVS